MYNNIFNPDLLLLCLKWHREKDPRTPLATAFLQSSLEREDINTCLKTFPVQSTSSLDIIHLIEDIQPRIVAWGVYIWNEQITQEILGHSAEFNSKICLGGPQITYTKSSPWKSYPNVKYFIQGEGENSLPDLISGIIDGVPDNQLIKIPGVCIKGQQYKCEIASVNPSQIPSPYLSGLYNLRVRMPFLRWQTQRGCPYNCSFCAHQLPAAPSTARNKIRYFDHERLFKELSLFQKFKVQEICVLDPIFNQNKSHWKPILKYASKIGFRGRIEAQCRLEILCEDFIRACKDLNMFLEFGLQTLNPRESILINRRNNLKKISYAFSLLNQSKISYQVHLIYGLPSQTLASAITSLDYLFRQGTPEIKCFPLVVLKGTPIASQAESLGLSFDKYRLNQIIETPSFLKENIDWFSWNSKMIDSLYNPARLMGFPSLGSYEGWKKFIENYFSENISLNSKPNWQLVSKIWTPIQRDPDDILKAISDFTF